MAFISSPRDLRGEPVGHVVLLLRRELLKLAERHVMVRQDETVGGHERSGPAIVEPHARQAEMIEPLWRDRKPVFLLNGCNGWVVERPHAFFGGGVDGEKGDNQDDDCQAFAGGHICRIMQHKSDARERGRSACGRAAEVGIGFSRIDPPEGGPIA